MNQTIYVCMETGYHNNYIIHVYLYIYTIFNVKYDGLLMLNALSNRITNNILLCNVDIPYWDIKDNMVASNILHWNIHTQLYNCQYTHRDLYVT